MNTCRKLMTLSSLLGLGMSILLWALCSLNIQWVLRDQRTVVYLGLGNIAVGQYDALFRQPSRITSLYNSNPGFTLMPYVCLERIQQIPSFAPQIFVVAPLWIPTLLFAIYPAVSVGRFVRRRGRKRRGVCVNCGYSLTMLTAPRCPECGMPTDLSGGA